MNELELKYDDYVEETEIAEEEKSNFFAGAMYAFLDGYFETLNETPADVEDFQNVLGYLMKYVNVGFSFKNGYFTYRKSGDKYEIMRMGTDFEKAFLRIVIYNIELPKLNRVFSMVTDLDKNPDLEDSLNSLDKELIYKVTYDLPKFRKDFERVYPDIEFKYIMYYPTYILRRLRTYYDGLPVGLLEFDEENNKVKYIGNVPLYVIEFFNKFLKNATGMEWFFNGIDFIPVRENKDIKSDTGMTRKRVSEKN